MGARILVVEDNALNLKLIKDVLEFQGSDVVTARSGEEGVAVASSSSLDLVLMDLQLPGIGGHEALSPAAAIHHDARLDARIEEHRERVLQGRPAVEQRRHGLGHLFGQRARAGDVVVRQPADRSVVPVDEQNVPERIRCEQASRLRCVCAGHERVLRRGSRGFRSR